MQQPAAQDVESDEGAGVPDVHGVIGREAADIDIGLARLARGERLHAVGERVVEMRRG